jgi:hypothetical protein
MSGESFGGSPTSRRALIATATAGLAVGGGALLPMVTRASSADAAITGIPWLVEASGDTTGATDVTNVQNALTTYGVAWLGPGTYYANATVTAHEGQYVEGVGIQAVQWNLVVSNIAAFLWTPAVSTSYSIHGRGGITGVTIINATSSGSNGNPSDGSIGVQMGDIVHLKCDVYVRNCEYGLMLSNQYFWTERGDFTVQTDTCTNPVICECATSGGSNRSGSFDRTRLTWYSNETMGSGGLVNGVQLLNGAQFVGGAIRIYGNVGGTGEAGVYALYLDGASNGPIYSSNSSIIGAELTMVIETSITSTPPGTIYLGSGCYIMACDGTISCNQFGNCTIVGSTFEYFGAIDGTVSSGTSIQQALWNTISSGFPAGVTGIVHFKRIGQGDEVHLDVSLALAASTTLTQNQTLFTLPSGFEYASDNKLISLVLNAYDGGLSATFHYLHGSGQFTWGSPTLTTSSKGISYVYGQATYATQV